MALGSGEPLAAAFEPADRPRRHVATRRRSAQHLGDQSSAGGGASGALDEQIASLRPGGDAAPQALHGAGGSAQTGAESFEASDVATRPGQLLPQRAQRSDATGD